MTTEVEDVKPAESSPAETAAPDVTEASSTPAPEPNLDLATYTPDQVREWKNTGAVPPIAATVPEPSADSATAENPAGASKEDKPATESAPVSQQQEKKGKSNYQTRIRELLKQNAQLKAELAGSKTAPPATAQTTPATPAKTDEIPAPSPAPKLPKVAKPAKPAKPIWGENPEEDWEQFEVRQSKYETERDEYQEHLIQYSLAEDRREREKERLEAETAAQNQAVARDWSQRVASLKSKPGFEDYDEVIAPLLVRDNPPIPTGSVTDGFILDSAVGPELLHYFGQHLDEAAAVGHMAPFQAARVLAMLEQDLLHKAAAEKQAAPEPKAEAASPKKPVVTPITRAARPATNLQATNARPVSEIEAAVAADDFGRFRRIKDLEDIERRRRG